MTTSPDPGGLGRRLARNTLHAASGRVLAIAVWLVLTPALYRSLGVEGYAVWSLFYALTGWLGSLDLGFSQAALRYVAAARTRDDHAEAGEYATLASLGYVALGLAWLALTPLAREPLLDFLRIHGAARANAAFAFTAGAVVFLFSGLMNTTVGVLQGYDRFDLANLVMLANSLAQAAGIVAAIVRRAPFAAYVVASGAGWLVAWLVGLALLGSRVRGFRWGAPGASARHLGEAARFGGPMQAANVLAVAHQQVDKLLLARFVALASAAPYELGLRVSTSASTFPQLLLLAMMPAASALHAADRPERLLELYRRVGRYVTAVSAVVAAALTAAAPSLYTAWLGAPQPDAARALRGLALAMYVALASGVAAAIARGVGRTTLELESSAAAFAVHVAAGVVLVPRWGLTGALAALVAGNLVSAAWFLARLSGALGWPRLRTTLEPFGVPALALAAGWLAGAALAPHLGGWPAAIVSAGAGAAVALALLVASRHLSLREALGLAFPARRA